MLKFEKLSLTVVAVLIIVISLETLPARAFQTVQIQCCNSLLWKVEDCSSRDLYACGINCPEGATGFCECGNNVHQKCECWCSRK